MMRSRIVVGGVSIVLLLTLIGTCRQQASTQSDRLEPVPSSANVDPPPSSANARTTTTSTDVSISSSPDSETEASQTNEALAGRPALLTADDPDAVINVRSLPDPGAEPIGTGQVGDQVILEQAATAEDGFVWHYVTFRDDDATVGWIRADLLDIQPAAEAPPSANTAQPHTDDVLKQALDEQCGGTRAIEAYFIAQSHTIYICKIRNQRLYLSQESGTRQVVTAQEVKALGGGYIISNGNFEYRLDAGSFVVVHFDDSGRQEEVIRESIVYTERY